MVRKNKGFRIDYNTEIVETEKNEDGTFNLVMKLIPDPKRYQLTTKNGVDGYWSESDQLFIPLEVLKKSWEEMPGKPIYLTPPD